jgi:hypothetical protein
VRDQPACHPSTDVTRTATAWLTRLPDTVSFLRVAKTLVDDRPGQLHVKVWVHAGEDPGRRP